MINHTKFANHLEAESSATNIWVEIYDCVTSLLANMINYEMYGVFFFIRSTSISLPSSRRQWPVNTVCERCFIELSNIQTLAELNTNFSGILCIGDVLPQSIKVWLCSGYKMFLRSYLSKISKINVP